MMLWSLVYKEDLVNAEWESRAIFLTIYDDLYKTYLWGICITLNLFVALTSAIYDVINMAAICQYMNYSYFHQNQLKTSHYYLFCKENTVNSTMENHRQWRITRKDIAEFLES